ncbi:MAG: metalloregulator ArsR/SmtB family transcription factor [Thermoanaerobaculia bacterium]|nr:metalloregulator ArsR/SmtB family transcription factor [Thermoanaerobaculia bacterium]
MVEFVESEELSNILKAVSDPTRRSILTILVQEGPTRVTDLAAHYAMSLNAVSKHIKALERVGLVRRTTLGRTHLIEANMEPVSTIDRWFRELRSTWEIRLEALETLLTQKEDSDG